MENNYDIKFHSQNSIVIKQDDKVIKYIACPPTTAGCDIINFNDKLYPGYTFDFPGLIIITNESKRQLYCKGKLLSEVENK